VSTDPEQTYQASLRSTHAAERQGLQQMETQLPGLDDYPEYAALLRRHVEVTRGQIARIEAALEETGSGTSAIKEGVTAAIGTVAALGHKLASDETLKNLYAGYAYQYEQIGAYRSLAVIAERAGLAAHRGWIEQSITEEEEAADAVKALIEPVTNRYLDLRLKD